MTLQTCTVELAGLTLVGAYDGNDYWVSTPEISESFGWEPKRISEKLTSKSLKAFAGKEIKIRKGARGRGNAGMFNSRDFSIIVAWQAQEGNTGALSLLIALTKEAIERRIDNSLGLSKSEEDYEVRTASFFRELARKSFMPKYTDWLKLDQDNGDIKQRNYGILVNQLKLAAGLDKVNIDNYTQDDMERWSEAITCYNFARKSGHTHKQALVSIAETTK